MSFQNPRRRSEYGSSSSDAEINAKIEKVDGDIAQRSEKVTPVLPTLK